MNIHFAPLQGYTDANYRNAHSSIFGGIETYYTPFVRLEKGQFRSRDMRDIQPENNNVPHLIPQFISNGKDQAETILSLLIENQYKEIDINLGCPFPMLAKRHYGSGMLPHVEEVTQLLEIIKNHSEIKFSIKMRLGWEQPDECLKLVPILNELPLQQVTIHPRLGTQQYKGTVDLNGFEAFAAICNHPLIYNGDITSVEDIKRVESRYPFLSGVMIGRGLLMNPALGIEYKEDKELTPGEMRENLLAMHKLVYARYEKQIQGGEGQLLNKMKTFWEYLEPQIGHKTWKSIHKSTSLAKYQAAIGLL